MTPYGTLPDGTTAHLFTLRNKDGMVARLTDFGAILVGLEVPDQNGTLQDVTLGYDSLEGWIKDNASLGATVGRFGNRIAHGKFSLNGEDYTLATNNEPGGIPCALHGGLVGFNKKLWSADPFEETDRRGIRFTYVSPDGEEGYPGTLTSIVTYTLTDANELLWTATATVEGKATPVNLVHHTYWNLSGDPTTSINDHLLTLEADHFLPTNPGLIPTGDRAPVTGTPLDFSSPHPIGDRVETPDRDLQLAGGYDHCWVLRDAPTGQTTRLAATLHDPKSGRTLTLHTDQPGVQFYGGNFLDGSALGKNGIPYQRRCGCCLETEAFPDAPNQPTFPSAILHPGQTYSHTMIHQFSW